MYDYHRNALPDVFTDFFVQVKRKHDYNTRLASKKFILYSYSKN